MSSAADDWSKRLPKLFADAYVEYAAAHISYRSWIPPDPLVSRLHLVAVTGEGLIVVCRSVQGWRFLPGGTREPAESLPDLARRELAEEAGAELYGDLLFFSAHRVDSEREKPYRPHLPHPRAYWAYAVVRVKLTGAPTNPVDGEQVVEVLTLPPAAAAEYLAQDDPVHADITRHAAAMGLLDQFT